MKKYLTPVAFFACLILCVSGAWALETPVNFDRWPDGGAERNLDDILDSLYGWGNLERIDDAVDTHWVLANTGGPNALDGGAIAQAKYAGFGETFGYWAGGTFHDLFSIAPGSGNNFDNGIGLNPTVLDGTIDEAIVGSGPFELGLDPSGTNMVWSSDPTKNDKRKGQFLDHMVTYRIVGGANNEIGNYVVAWEDLPILGDHDYNDVVIELSGVRPTPEPGTVILMGLGLLGLGILQLRRK
ncbi:hypothetical protein CSB20_04225 [bacterium DOLZORAL124_64_63]|nr:MAG: hypothetical protein CSB20_04225 [bacterium DOLZORAL124_64_63]